jgi:DNA-binding transcriptional LysR family regulator
VKVASIPEPIMLVVPNSHPFATAKSVMLKDLAGQTLAIPDVTFGVRRIFDRAIQEAGLSASLNIALASNMFEVLREFVRSGAGVAILPYRAVFRESTQNALQAVHGDHPALRDSTIDIVALRKHHPARIVTSFIDQLLQTFEMTAVKK